MPMSSHPLPQVSAVSKDSNKDTNCGKNVLLFLCLPSQWTGLDKTLMFHNNLHKTPLLNNPKCVAQLQRMSSWMYRGPQTSGSSA